MIDTKGINNISPSRQIHPQLLSCLDERVGDTSLISELDETYNTTPELKKSDRNKW